MKIDPVLKVALSLHNNPGVYALLIGSGVSRAAGIPTGWEIVLDLIRKLATLKNESPDPDPETWYRNKYGQPPNYTSLLEQLTSTPAERQALLRAYFEPTEEEREQGLKIPTAAHRAIAELVKNGHIRMILTTNFDRFIERALQDIGIEADVISTDDDLKGAMPYVHSKCYVVKLHGDYLDTRIKNTPEELANYSDALNAFLDRIFDEFGLIICGWSGAWDTALREAILRCPNRRFTTFWLAKGELTEEARKIIQHRQAEVIPIESANQFFIELNDRLKSLSELERPHPISTSVAVATVKRYMAEPRHRIRLHDLLHEETERVYEELSSDRFKAQIPQFTNELFQARMRQYEAAVERLMSMLAALSYYDTGENARLLTRCIERIASCHENSDNVALRNLQRYPALLLIYSSGISAVAAQRFPNLAAILLGPLYYDKFSEKKVPIVAQFHVWSVFGDTYKIIPYPNAKSRYTPVSDYLFNLLRPMLRDYLPDEQKYEEAFDIFEYLLALTYMDLVRDSWSPTGRFGWRHKLHGWDRFHLSEFLNKILDQGTDSELLRAGFFGGSVERLKELAQAHKEWVQRATEGWW